MWKPPPPTPIFPIPQMIVPCLEDTRNYRIISILYDFVRVPLIPFLSLAPRLYSHLCYRSRKTKSDCSSWLRFWSFAKCFSSPSLAPAEARTFHALEMPPLPSPGSLLRAPWAHPVRGTRPALAGVFKSAWAAARGAAAGFLVGRAGTWGEQPPPACALPFLRRDASEITPRAGRAGPAGEGIPGEWGRGAGLPPRPGNTRGTPGLPRAASLPVWTRVHPRGRFPGGRGGRTAARGRRAERTP